MEDALRGAVPATLEDILLAREERARRQRRLISLHHLPVLTISLNITGCYKQFPLAVKTYVEAKKLVTRHLERLGAHLADAEEKRSVTGNEGCFVVCGADAARIKKALVQIEETLPLARLFDLDVMDVNGVTLSRRDLGLSPRSCLICSREAAVCARSVAHSREEVLRKSVFLMRSHFEHKMADTIASLAIRSLLYEVCVTPKPGLVDRNNNGAHRDMDIFSFMSSASVLFPYFKHCALVGRRRCGSSPEDVFNSLRYPGMEAEDAMYAATNGVNTHKGAIFLLGIVCAAAGLLTGQSMSLSTDNLCRTVAAMTKGLVQECQTICEASSAGTNGEACIKMGVLGIRGEVMNGLPSVTNHALPTLRSLLDKEISPDRAGALTLLHLMAGVTDTNVIKRSSLATAEVLRENLRGFLEKEGEPDTSHLLQLDREYISLNISPGGCADLLGIAFMLLFLEKITLA